MANHLHTLQCLKKVQGNPELVVEPLELSCGCGPTVNLQDPSVVKELGINSLVDDWIQRKVEFSEDGSMFRLRTSE